MYSILICDDDRDIVNALKIYLSEDSYQLIEAFNGQEALQIIKKQDIHLVLMDIMMPVMDGMEAMAEIRRFSNVPIILLTAKSEDIDIISGLEVGARRLYHQTILPYGGQSPGPFSTSTLFASWFRSGCANPHNHWSYRIGYQSQNGLSGWGSHLFYPYRI